MECRWLLKLGGQVFEIIKPSPLKPSSRPLNAPHLINAHGEDPVVVAVHPEHRVVSPEHVVVGPQPELAPVDELAAVDGGRHEGTVVP